MKVTFNELNLSDSSLVLRPISASQHLDRVASPTRTQKKNPRNKMKINLGLHGDLGAIGVAGEWSGAEEWEMQDTFQFGLSGHKDAAPLSPRFSSSLLFSE